MAISGVCTNCFFLKTIPYNVFDPNAGAVTQNISVCVNRVPKTEHANPNLPQTQLGRASWAIIDFPNDWTCGEGADATTGVSYSAGVSGPSGPAGAGYLATSTTSLSITNSGTRIFATQAGLAYSYGARVRATSVAGGHWMEGVVSSYSGTTLSVNMDLSDGDTGTYAAWSLNVAGQTGSTGTAGVNLLATLTASNSASLSDTTHITAAYDLYEFTFENVAPVTGGDPFMMQVSTDAGATWKNTTYFSQNSSDAIYLLGTAGASSTKGFSGTARIFGVNRTDNRKVVTSWILDTTNAGGIVPVTAGGYWDGGNDAINAVRFLMGTSNISTGKIRIYGINTT